MVVEQEIRSFSDWLMQGEPGKPGALLQFGITFGALALLALIVGFLVLLVRYGPMKAGDLTYRTVMGGVSDLFRMSPRRILAMAWLAVKESFRRRAFVIFLVFVVILIFAGWFLGSNYQDPASLYIDFVLTASTYLVLALGLLLSAFSLPNDFKSKTIYTIVTKPVRSNDIVLGRIFGFTAVGTILLAMMAAAGYLFVDRSLHHTHTVEVDSLENLLDAEGNVIGKTGQTSYDAYHRHEIEIDNDGNGVALPAYGHDHNVEKQGDKIVTSGPLSMMRARVPKRGTISFRDRKGVPVAKGVNVGNEWTYRSFIEGGSSAAAIWTFDGIDETVLRTEEDGTQVLPVELIVRVFRTYKGDLERGIQGSIQLRNPETKVVSSLRIFPAKDYLIDSFDFPREQYDKDQNPIDLIDDLVSSDGKIEVWVQSLERAQYFGFAQADAYIRLPDGSPVWNYIKGYISIWVQMVVVITIGVTASTFLNGPIATMFTVSFILLGFFREFFVGVAKGTEYGGGPVESLVRLVTQKNLTSKFDPGPAVSLMEGIDTVLQAAMQGIALLLPDFRSLSLSSYVSEGFSIPGPMIGRELAIAAAYIVGLSIAGYFFLRTREVAK